MFGARGGGARRYSLLGPTLWLEKRSSDSDNLGGTSRGCGSSFGKMPSADPQIREMLVETGRTIKADTMPS